MTPGDPVTLVAEARSGSRGALARLLTYVESASSQHRATVAVAYASPPPYVLGLTGPPGAGKSTLGDLLIRALLDGAPLGEAVERVAVLCVDPSSPFTGGAILGDRIRMQEHATDERVFIRSMATRGHLGGLSLAVPDAVRVLGAVGFALVIVETVGVGQMEVEIASAADSTVVVTNPGWGDSMQANKAGLLEVADVFVINKADRSGVEETRRDLEQMLDLGRSRPWRPPIVETSATERRGVGDLVAALDGHRRFLGEAALAAARRERTRAALVGVLRALVQAQTLVGSSGAIFEELVDALSENRTDPYRAAETLLSTS